MKFTLKQFTALLLFFGFTIGLSHSVEAQGTVSEKDPNVIEYPVKLVPLATQVDPMSINEDWFPYVRNYHVVHKPGIDAEKDEIYNHKKNSTKAWKEARDAGLAPLGQTVNGANKVQAAAIPTIGTDFFGNPHDGGIPNDNEMAVSKHGYVVSATNSQIRAWNSWGGSPIFAASMQGFTNSLGGQALKYDPMVNYHHSKDRFIFVFLVGDASAFSRVLVAFSTTPNPADPWNIYTLDGNATGSVWTDFPQTALTRDELVITGNMFTDLGFGVGSVVWQVGLDEGFNGDPLVTKRYTSSYFSLHPVEGAPELTDYPLYLVRSVSNPVTPTKSLFIHELTGNIGSNPTMNPPVALNTSVSYILPPNASQPGVNTPDLMTNDCRTSTAYINGNRIEYAHNTALNGQANGRPSIFHGTIELASNLTFSSATGKYVTVDSFELGYPGIAWGGCTGADGSNSSVIMFCFTSTNHFPGTACVFENEAGEISDPLVLKNGFTYMGDPDSTEWRWGDYADAQERTNNPGEVWIAGGIGQGASTHQNATWISMVYTECNAGPVGIDTELEKESLEMTAYPNPTVEMIYFKFEVPKTDRYLVKIVDLQGKVVKEVVSSRLKEGAARAQFNTQPLTNGLYFVVVENETEMIHKEKFVVKH